jgi:phosphoglycerol geranylgeranyltransferase
MMEIQSTERYILNEIKKQKTLCFPLIDSENTSKTMEIAKRLEQLGASAILVGGSSTSDQIELSNFVTELKSNVKIPIILFPGNITGISPAADAILFSSLLNSENPYYITGAQAQGALVINKHQIEAIPTGYLIIGDGSTAWFIGQARSIPFSKANIAVMYALAALYMGMRFLYLEAGSGASQNIPPEMVSIVRKFYKGILIVGGGINSAETAKKISDAGADIIVIGTMIEREKDWEAEFVNIMKAIRN